MEYVGFDVLSCDRCIKGSLNEKNLRWLRRLGFSVFYEYGAPSLDFDK